MEFYTLYEDHDIKKIATIVRPKTSGASIKWNSVKNLPKVKYEIPSKDLKRLSDITKDLSRTDKMQFGKRLSSEFLSSHKLKDEQKQSRLSPKDFIHSKGLWDDYMIKAKREIKKYEN